MISTTKQAIRTNTHTRARARAHTHAAHTHTHIHNHARTHTICTEIPFGACNIYALLTHSVSATSWKSCSARLSHTRIHALHWSNMHGCLQKPRLYHTSNSNDVENGTSCRPTPRSTREAVWYEGQPKSYVTSDVKRQPGDISPPNFYKPAEHTPPLATHFSSLSHIWRVY